MAIEGPGLTPARKVLSRAGEYSAPPDRIQWDLICIFILFQQPDSPCALHTHTAQMHFIHTIYRYWLLKRTE